LVFNLHVRVSTAKIDVVMITSNSLYPCLKESLSSIVRNIPLNYLIVVDSFSADGTLKLFDRYRKEDVKIKIVQRRCSRGKAREIGIREVETEWFAFVDSDVILAENWYRDIANNIKPRVGAIEGNVNKQKISPSGRAYTNCTLIKTNLAKDIRIPEEMQVLEDQYIRKCIEKKGYRWLKVSGPCSIHKSTSDRKKDAFEVGRLSGKYKLLPFWKDFFVCLLIPVKLLKHGESPSIYLNKLLGHLRGILERRSLW
jgi:glycosyltransferase involved in cell wall biosynthesis